MRLSAGLNRCFIGEEGNGEDRWSYDTVTGVWSQCRHRLMRRCPRGVEPVSQNFFPQKRYIAVIKSN